MLNAEDAARMLGHEVGEYLGSGVSAEVWALTDRANVLKHIRGTYDDFTPYRRVMRLQRRGLCRAFATVRAELPDPDSGWWFVQERVQTARQLHMDRTWRDVELCTLHGTNPDPITADIARSVSEAGWYKLTDLHVHNVGFRPDWSVAVIDLGSGYTPESSPLPGPVPFERVRRALGRLVAA